MSQREVSEISLYLTLSTLQLKNKRAEKTDNFILLILSLVKKRGNQLSKQMKFLFFSPSSDSCFF